MRRNRFPRVWTLAAVALTIVTLIVSSANAGLVAVSAYTGSNNKDNYGGNMSDLISGEEMTKTDPNDPSTWTATLDHYSHEWQTASLLSGATNGKIAWTALDFGTTVANLENAYFWNIREATGQNRRTVDYNIYYATSPTVALPAAPTSSSSIDYDFSSGGWTLLNATPLTMPQRGAAPDPANQVVALGGVSARYVGVEILTNAGDTNRAGLSEIAITEGPAAAGPVIYEPFDYDVGNLHGQDGGTGFAGPWVRTKRNPQVTAANNTWGTLVTSGNRVNSNAWSALTRPIGSTLSDAGLMDNGATLWFSYVMDISGQNLTNLDFNFALCTDPFEAGDYSNRTNLVGGEGIGLGNYRPNIKGKYWQNNDADPIAEGVTADTTLTLNATDNARALIVGKIEWGATDTDAELLTLYAPDPDMANFADPEMALGTPILSAWATAALDQSLFDSLSIQFKDSNPSIDEIRFGATLQDVMPYTVPEPSTFVLAAFGLLAPTFCRRRRKR